MWKGFNVTVCAGAQSLLVEEFVSELSGPDRGGQDSFVLGKGLLGDERARQVQLAARPLPCAGAEPPHVLEHALHLRRREDVAERRHPAIERAHRPAPLHDRRPVGVGLRGGKAAIGEIRQRGFEPNAAARLAAAVRAVTRGARPLVQLGAATDLSGSAHRSQRTERRDDRDDRPHVDQLMVT